MAILLLQPPNVFATKPGCICVLKKSCIFFLFLSVGSFFLFLVSVINPADTCFVTVLECFVMSSIVYGLIRNNGRVGNSAVADAFLRRTQTRQSCFPGLPTHAGCFHLVHVGVESPQVCTCVLSASRPVSTLLAKGLSMVWGEHREPCNFLFAS